MAQRKVLLAVGGTVAAGATVFSFTPRNPLNHLPTTPGVQNIENRYSAGGGSPNYLPAGGTERGTKNNNKPRSVTVQGAGATRAEEGRKTMETMVDEG